MSYSISQWKRCVAMLKAEPNKPNAQIRNALDLNFITCWDLVFDVVTIWKIPRKIKFIKTQREKEYFNHGVYKNQKQ